MADGNFKLEIDTRGLENLENDLRQRLSLIVRKATFDVETNAKQSCPVKTGNLKNSIQSSFPTELTGEVNVAANYAAYVEMGTVKARAQPFLGPAVDRVRDAFLTAAGRAIEEAAGG